MNPITILLRTDGPGTAERVAYITGNVAQAAILADLDDAAQAAARTAEEAEQVADLAQLTDDALTELADGALDDAITDLQIWADNLDEGAEPVTDPAPFRELAERLEAAQTRLRDLAAEVTRRSAAIAARVQAWAGDQRHA